MDKTLQQIANAIVANLINTEPIGLFNGKIGICLFLYRYAQYSGSAVYEEIASELLDDVFNQLKPEMTPSMIDGVAGIGYGLVALLGEHLIESDPEDLVLDDLDRALLCNVNPSLMKEIHYPVSLYSSGMYLLSRLSYDKTNVEQGWITNVIEQANNIVLDCISKKQYNVLKLSFLNSMLYVFLKLPKMMEKESKDLEYLLGNILHLSFQAIRQNNYQEIDLLLLRQNMAQLPLPLQLEYQKLLELMQGLECSSDNNQLEVWYDNLWWSIIYDIPIIKDVSLKEIECYIDTKVHESYFDGPIVNSKLAAVGLWLMTSDDKEEICVAKL